MYKPTLRFILFLSMFLFSSCFVSGNDDEKDQKNQKEADSMADEALGNFDFSQLSDKDGKLNFNAFEESKNQLEDALKKDPNNPKVNLGLAIMDILYIKHDEEVKAFNDKYFAGLRSKNNSFHMLVKSPQALHARLGDIWSTDISIEKTQKLIESEVIPKLKKVIERLEKVESHADVKIEIKNDEETVIIDLGEIYTFHASVHATLASLEMVTLFDLDFFDENNSYAWIKELIDLDLPEENHYYLKHEKDVYLKTEYSEKETRISKGILEKIKYNLESRDHFLRVRNTKDHGKKVLSHIQSVISKLTSADHFIRNSRTDNSSRLIKLTSLLEADNDIAGADEDKPNFAKNFKTLTDVLNFLNKFVTEKVDFDENNIKFSIHLASFLENISDAKSLLPKYKWYVKSEYPNNDHWINKKLVYKFNHSHTPGESFQIPYPYTEDTIIINDVDQVVSYVFEYEIKSPIHFLDNDGNSIDPDHEMPYFSDYTFGGLFPGMTRETLKKLTHDDQ